ncbi:DNA cytosine methyltransferase [Adlercreutzia sp.]|uniref:DNA cytosine methyltransferase n=1 Tax=Adlercreutzia sp. TaxID=1872387 RepID=UPI003AB3FD2A
MIADNSYNVNSFFAGIGGFDLGFEKAGFSNSFLCENNDFCNRVLASHWPDVLKAGDINEVAPSDIPDAPVWCGGFPCQDISVARGSMSRLGLNGSRSGLFYRFAELIGEKKPQVVLIENVAGLFNSNNGHDFGVILDTLNQLGYGVSWRLLNSRYFGVPQSRPRVYLCCWRGNPLKALASLFETSTPSKASKERTSFITESTPKGKYPRVATTGYCLAATSGRHTGTDWSRTYVTCKDGARRLTPIECERLQGFPDDWTKVEGDTEDADSHRYAAIGNAVSVPVINWIASRIKEQLASDDSVSFYIALPEYEPFDKATWVDLPDMGKEHGRLTWGKSGLMWNGQYLIAEHRELPCEPISTNLYEIVEKGATKPRYYLTPNAAEGILRRVDSNNRRLFEPLREGLELLSGRSSKEASVK